MKKFCGFLMVLILGLCFVACSGTDDEGEKTTPAIKGVEETLSLNVGDKLDLLKGVTAIGYKNDDLTSKIVVNHKIPVTEGKVTTAGNYTVRYSLKIDDEVVAQVIQTVTVIYTRPDTDTIIANGNFESGSIDPFTKSEFEGGAASLSVVDDGNGNKVMKVGITNVAWSGTASPRIEQEVSLEEGKIYEVSFKGYATVARTMRVSLGQLLSGAPWFIDIDPTVREFGFTQTAQTFTFRFRPVVTGNPDLSKTSLTFEFGTMADGNSAVTDCFLDDVSIVEVDSLGADTTAPTITINGNTKYYVGDEFNALSCVTVTDDQDTNPTVVVVEGESTLPTLNNNKLTTAGTYKVVYKATDAAGNESKAEYNFTVEAPAAAGSELLKNNNFSNTTATSDGFTDWVVFADAGNTMTHTIANGVVTLNINNTASVANWNPQFKQSGLQILEGKNYKLCLKLESSVARDVQIAIQNQDIWNNHLDKIVSLNANEEKTIEYTFTGIAPSSNVLFFLGLGKLNDKVVDGNHTVKVSGLSLKETTEEVADTTGPVITVTGDNAYFVGDEFDKNCATANDAVDGTVQVVIDTEKSILPEVDEDNLLTTPGKYKIVYTAIDKAGNKTTLEYTFKVVAQGSNDNYFGEIDETIKTGSTAGETESKKDPNVLYVFIDDQAWGGVKAEATAQYANGILNVEVTSTNHVWWGVQVFYTTMPLNPGKYSVSFKLNSTVAGNVKFANNDSVAIVAGDNTLTANFELTARSSYTFSLQLGTDAGKAIGAGTFKLSDFIITGEVADTPTGEINLTKPVGVVANRVPEGWCIAFAPVDNAVSYKAYLYLGETLVDTYEILNGGVIPAPTTPGTYTVKVQAIGNGSNIKDSVISDGNNFIIEG